jgi:hypothetical protein
VDRSDPDQNCLPISLLTPSFTYPMEPIQPCYQYYDYDPTH